ncbi:DUF2339 domain-containing protein [uncultured Cedecea sp.]|uniref:DUF2339 domain-containing protein n=1 Tax=uncultured Cedecea sp. TaxID=988762 RepID=UPI002607C5F6|nr:DUF2339 domain-containing protein [uncultured Cedecea sp.]
MDELIIFGCIILFFVVIVVPVLAIIAFNRSSALKFELVHLRRRVEQLELAGVQSAPVEPTAFTTPRSVVSVDNPSSAPIMAEERVPYAVQTAPVIPVSKEAETPTSILRDKPSAFDGMVTSLIRWFMQGNPLAKLGIILLFLGLSFLLRYTVEHSLFPLELRLAATGLGAMALLGMGWRLRHKKPLYALILQGGATGVLYLTVFGAFHLWKMLPMTLAFALLVLICAASVGLAVLQKALSLALLASLGGYLAPLLLSTGGGSHVGLFSFYLLLSIGILAISAWQHWRELNLLGLLFTFGVGGLWGLQSYQPEFYLSCQLFLLANVILFGVLSVALSLRAQQKGKRIVDGVLLFAPPLIGFGMQYAITQDTRYGPALSALGFGALYITLAWLALRRFPSLGKMFVLAAAVLGGAFVTLAIPLALSARWTSMAWALEGLGILWLGMQQQQRRMSYSGTALLLLSVLCGIKALDQTIVPLSLLTIFIVLSLCWLAASWLWRGDKLPLSLPLLIGGILFWLIALAGASMMAFGENQHAGFGVLGGLALSIWLWRYGANRLTWPELGLSVWLLWPAMWLALLSQIAQGHIFSAGWNNLAWFLALPSALLMLKLEADRAQQSISQVLHLALFWLLLLTVAIELWWFVDDLGWGMDAWRSGLLMAASALVILLVNQAIRRSLWPFNRWPALYGVFGVAPVLPVLVGLLLFANLQDGSVIYRGYLPLVNPLEEGAGFALLALWYYSHFAERHCTAFTCEIRHWRPLVFAGLGFWWLNGMLLRTLAWYGEVTWYFGDLWHSRLIQTTFTLFWMLTALVVMLWATRRHSRHEWLGGAALLGVVIVKLILVDSARGGGLARAIAFIGVAVLVLIIGYFSPLPPKAELPQNSGEEK